MISFQRGSRLVLSIHVDQGSLSTDHELASQTHHQMPTFRLLGCSLLDVCPEEDCSPVVEKSRHLMLSL